MADHGIALGQLEAEATRLADDGKTPMFVAIDGKSAGMVAVADSVKPESAAAIARQVGIDRALAEVAAQDKAHEVRKLQLEGRIVGMVGDDANAAPALTQADLGFAIGTATAIAVSKATMRNAQENLVGAFLYNTLGIPIAMDVLYPFMGILLSPMLAAAAMAASSVTVVTNANRLRGWRPSPAAREEASK